MDGKIPPKMGSAGGAALNTPTSLLGGGVPTGNQVKTLRDALEVQPGNGVWPHNTSRRAGMYRQGRPLSRAVQSTLREHRMNDPTGSKQSPQTESRKNVRKERVED